MVMGYPEQEDDKPKHAKPESQPEVEPEIEQSVDSNIVINQEEITVKDKFGVPWKSIIGFFTVFVGQLLARATVKDVAVIPQDFDSWLALFGGSAVAALAIWAKSNVYTVEQAQAKVEVAINKAQGS